MKVKTGMTLCSTDSGARRVKLDMRSNAWWKVAGFSVTLISSTRTSTRIAEGDKLGMSWSTQLVNARYHDERCTYRHTVGGRLDSRPEQLLGVVHFSFSRRQSLDHTVENMEEVRNELD